MCEKNDVEAKLKELEERYRELEEYAKRLKAEYENYRDEVAKERREIIKNANEYLIAKLVPILEDFERALNQTDHSNTSFYEGVKLIYKKLINVLEKEGLVKISVRAGEKFNPFEHEAYERVETDSVEEYTILEVLEEGYKYHGKVLKPAKVKVAVKPAKPVVEQASVQEEKGENEP